MIPFSELILNPDGSIYHLHLLPDHISDTILTVGDPGRVAQVSRHFDSVEFEGAHREFVTHVGYHKGKRLTVLSTGMGTDNIDIVLNELDALVNIDFMARAVRPVDEQMSLRIVRLGTSGSLRPDVPIGAVLATEHAVGLDSLMQFYPLVETGLETQVATELQAALGLPFAPYVVRTVGGRGSDGQYAYLPRFLRPPGPSPAPRCAARRLPRPLAQLPSPKRRRRVSPFQL